MVRWPIRIKLMVGLGVVVGMMLILMGGSIFGLHSFHVSNLTLTDQLRELGASKDLIECILRLHPPDDSAEDADSLLVTARRAQAGLLEYFHELKQNTMRGNRANSGFDELGLAFRLDDDLTAIINELSRSDPPEAPILPGTTYFVTQHPELLRQLDPTTDLKSSNLAQNPDTQSKMEPATDVKARIDRLKYTVMRLPKELHDDFYDVLVMSKTQYQISRVIVWTSALAVLPMLCGLTALFHRWVLYPVRLLQRGVRRVARGSFDYKIDLHSGDEMQDLAGAFNEMTARISMTYADLEQQVQERSRQLVRSERLAGVGFLAAGVAHEINNPLASIAFCSEALENRLEALTQGSDDPDHRAVSKYLKMIQEEAFRCKNITEKLLDFARCNDIKRERTDLPSLVQGVVDMIRHIGKYRGKTIVFQPKEAIVAHVDGQEIKQVILNLVVNALESMDAGGVLRIDARYDHGMAEVIFNDNGCGIAADVLENIFEPFFTRRRDGKGTGLGLSITHRIVNQHHGEITATSPGEGRGSTFRVRLPIHPSEIGDGPGGREPAVAGASRGHAA
ncbi:MAG: ATP-binding protein [Paludisphaera borealis]|uniref:sensor histidine kinase n=1 Tax=Paludisphaera borealis TaxID=1387353 RepID=UPI002850A8A4|nr:ATP-binding protein [Paludisphaera borealis]MDR3620357.1 ATP-binding protein [Paludisphaera borealis]